MNEVVHVDSWKWYWWVWNCAWDIALQFVLQTDTLEFQHIVVHHVTWSGFGTSVTQFLKKTTSPPDTNGYENTLIHILIHDVAERDLYTVARRVLLYILPPNNIQRKIECKSPHWNIVLALPR